MKASADEVERLIWELRRAFRDLAATADRELRPMGIQARDRALLEFLARESEPVSISALAEKHSVSRQHIHQTLRGLTQPGWVEEAADPADRRAVLLRLSRQGRALWERIRRVDEAFFAQLAGNLDANRVASAARLLQELRQQLQPAKEAVNE